MFVTGFMTGCGGGAEKDTATKPPSTSFFFYINHKNLHIKREIKITCHEEAVGGGGAKGM